MDSIISNASYYVYVYIYREYFWVVAWTIWFFPVFGPEIESTHLRCARGTHFSGS